MPRFRLDKYLEKWATKYKPIAHDPSKGSRNKRVFRMNSINHLEDFAKTLPSNKSPSVGVVTEIKIDSLKDNAKMLLSKNTSYIFIRQDSNDEIAAADAKQEGVDIAFDLIAYIDHDRKTNKDIQGINMDSVSVYSAPVKIYGWWIIEVFFEQQMPRPLCIDSNKYTNI